MRPRSLKSVLRPCCNRTLDKEKLADIVTAYQQRKPEKIADLQILTDVDGLEGVAAGVRANLSKGLAGNDANERRAFFGSNMRAPPPVRGFCQIIWDALGDTLLRVLFFSGIISIIINEATEDDKTIAWIDGFGMILAVAIVALVSSFNDWQKEQQFQELNKTAEQANVVRSRSAMAGVDKIPQERQGRGEARGPRRRWRHPHNRGGEEDTRGRDTRGRQGCRV